MSQPQVGPSDTAAKPAPRPGLVALVVTFNRLAQLQTTVSRLLAEDVDAVVVVNNASSDGTADYLASQENPRLHVVTLDRNRGGAGGFEQGLKAATDLYDADWFVLMDDDARPLSGTIAQFRSQAELMRKWDAVAAGVYYPDGEICEMNRPSRNPFWHPGRFLRTLFGGGRAGFHLRDDEFQARSVAQIDVTSFVGFFLSRAAIARVGLPNGKLFLYGDDVVYTLGLSRAGGAIGFAPWLRFEHDCSTLRRGEGHIHRPLWKAYYNYRNGLLGYRAAAGPLMFWPALCVVVVKWSLKSRGYGRDRGVFLRLLGVAVSDALRGNLDRSHDEVVARSQTRQGCAVRRG